MFQRIECLCRVHEPCFKRTEILSTLLRPLPSLNITYGLTIIAINSGGNHMVYPVSGGEWLPVRTTGRSAV